MVKKLRKKQEKNLDSLIIYQVFIYQLLKLLTNIKSVKTIHGKLKIKLLRIKYSKKRGKIERNKYK